MVRVKVPGTKRLHKLVLSSLAEDTVLHIRSTFTRTGWCTRPLLNYEA